MMTYLDWAATSPPDLECLSEGARVAAECFGNPSSKHALGVEARNRLEEARSRLAAAIGIPSALPGVASAAGTGRLVFTSGGTEADGIPLLAVLRSALNAKRDGSIKRLHVVTTEIEHAAVYEEAQLLKSLGLGVSFINPEADGRVDPGKIAGAIEKDTALVSVMAVNNETGAIQDLAGISRSAQAAAEALGRAAPRFHSDAVQALGKVELAFAAPGAQGPDSFAFSAHKIRGPRGVGALWTTSTPESLALGGGQEWALRPGTENLQGIWAFAAAAEAARASFAARQARARALEARLFDGIASIPGALPLPEGRKPGDPRYSPFILSVAFPGLSGEVLARVLSDSDVAVSTGSACSSNSKRKGRRVLRAMGMSEEISLSAVRVSTGESSTEAEVDRFLEAAESAYRRLKT
jgi:cysteine desulfurase